VAGYVSITVRTITVYLSKVALQSIHVKRFALHCRMCPLTLGCHHTPCPRASIYYRAAVQSHLVCERSHVSLCSGTAQCRMIPLCGWASAVEQRLCAARRIHHTGLVQRERLAKGSSVPRRRRNQRDLCFRRATLRAAAGLGAAPSSASRRSPRTETKPSSLSTEN
jgi:hypothetical protein